MVNIAQLSWYVGWVAVMTVSGSILQYAILPKANRVERIAASVIVATCALVAAMHHISIIQTLIDSH